MKPFYIIFVRPPGSITWTQYMKTQYVPWRSCLTREANKKIRKIVEQDKMCARAVLIDLPAETDTELFGALTGGDTVFVAAIDSPT